MASRVRLESKIKSPRALAGVLSKLPRSARVVFTNGCFDILHRGHVSYLERARLLGTHLVVALNGDASVARLKGPTRPVNPLEDRLRVIAALEAVSFVTWFDEDDPVALITRLKPKVLVKGGDWKPEQILGSREVRSWGGTVRSLAFLEGRSTTAILSRAKTAPRSS